MIKNKRKRKYTPSKAVLVRRLAEEGFTNEEIAEFFGVDAKSIRNWEEKFPLFFESLRAGKAIADAKVEASLYQRAMGYTIPDVHISNYQGVITKTVVLKHFAPDITAQIFWLKCRCPDKWADKQKIEYSGNPVQILLSDNITKGLTVEDVQPKVD